MKNPIPYRNSDKWGFSNSEKEMLIDCIYDDIVFPFTEENFNLALVKIGSKFCWINSIGQQICPLADKITPFTSKEISVLILDDNNFNTLQSTKNCLFINSLGEKVFDIDAITSNSFQNDLCIVYFSNKKYGVINSLGEFVLEPEYEDYLKAWEKIGKPYFYDRNEIPKKTHWLFKFESNRYFGFKDADGKIVIEPKYYFANDFCEDTSIVAKEPKAFHHINSHGQRLYDKNYYFGHNFENEIAKVVTDSLNTDPFLHTRWGVDYYIPENAKWGFIDKKGVEFWND